MHSKHNTIKIKTGEEEGKFKNIFQNIKLILLFIEESLSQVPDFHFYRC